MALGIERVGNGRVSDVAWSTVEDLASVMVPMTDFVAQRVALASGDAVGIDRYDGAGFATHNRRFAFVQRLIVDDGAAAPGDRLEVNVFRIGNAQTLKDAFRRRYDENSPFCSSRSSSAWSSARLPRSRSVAP